MFDKLKRKWNVSATRVLLILCTFALGGTLSGYLAKLSLRGLAIGNSALRLVVYLLLVTLIWPIAVLAVSLLFGQFRFFLNYLKRLGLRLGLIKKST